jgi:hypothetical protein
MRSNNDCVFLSGGEEDVTTHPREGCAMTQGGDSSLHSPRRVPSGAQPCLCLVHRLGPREL